MFEQHDIFQGENVSQRTTNEPFVCLVCAKSFKYQRNLDTHISITHTATTTTYKLKRHMAELHNVTQFGNSIYSEEAKTFNCMVCESVFKRKENLKAHEKTHLDGSKFTCDKCGKQFTVKSSLVRHQKMHTGEREKHQCEICQKIFLSKGSLGRHIEGIHRR